MVVGLPVPPHPIVDAVSRMRSVITEVCDANPTFMAAVDQATALGEITALQAQLTELQARVFGAAAGNPDFIATFGSHPDGWLAHATHCGAQQARTARAFALRIASHEYVGTALRSGALTADQADQICRSIDALPPGTSVETVTAAEQHLVALAGEFDPRQLRVLGRRVLVVVSPEAADEQEGRLLEAEERRAAHATRFTMRANHDGTTRIAATVPDLIAARLGNYLHAIAAPRRHPGSPDTEEQARVTADDSAAAAADSPRKWWHLPAPARLGQAFCELVERINPSKLPHHGSETTHLIVTMPLEALRTELSAASVLGPDGALPISASEARRLACAAGLIPAVLGAKDQPLNLGRTRRLASKAQKRALMLLHQSCQAAGCDRPAAWTEVHHLDPWASGGRTDLDRMVLLCSRDHHRIHDPAFTHTVSTQGQIEFHRRE